MRRETRSPSAPGRRRAGRAWIRAAACGALVAAPALPIAGCSGRAAPTAWPSGSELVNAGASAPYGSTVILVGLDGFRWDFFDRAATPHLDRLVASGVRAERLVPVFPSKTFPNHYSIVTGLYPARHGIVSNTMYDPEFDALFRLGDRAELENPRWWGGEPIWVTAERQGVRTAAFFWPGTEAPIQGVQPTHWKAYDESIPNEARVDQILAWLDMPTRRRPRFLALYFSDVDDAAHDHGPEPSAALAAAVAEVDAELGRLLDGLAARGLDGRVHVIVVSDHGMAATSPERVIFLDDFIDTGMVVDWSPVLALWPPAGEVEAVYGRLSGAHPHLRVYRRGELATRLRYAGHRRIPPIVGLADEGWTVTTRAAWETDPESYRGGDHGYDPELPSMGGLFVAAGPQLSAGRVEAPLANVHLYNLMCLLLGITPAPNEGDLAAVAEMLREPPPGATVPAGRVSGQRTGLAGRAAPP